MFFSISYIFPFRFHQQSRFFLSFHLFSIVLDFSSLTFKFVLFIIFSSSKVFYRGIFSFHDLVFTNFHLFYILVIFLFFLPFRFFVISFSVLHLFFIVQFFISAFFSFHFGVPFTHLFFIFPFVHLYFPIKILFYIIFHLSG